MNYPQSEKLLAVKDKSQLIGGFLEWLQGKAILAQWVENEDEDTNDYMPDVLIPLWHYKGGTGIQRLLAEYFEIDLDALEEERRQMLEELVRKNEQ